MKRPHLWQRLVSFVAILAKLIMRHYRALLLLLMGVLVPLAIFGELAEEVGELEGGFPWDEPILLSIHEMASAQVDSFAVVFTQFGIMWGVFPASLVVAALLGQRHYWRSLVYFLVTTTGSFMLNVTVKTFMARVRPALWDSPTPEFDFAFPSGHAMASMTFVVALVIVLQGSRWQWVATVLGGLFVIAIGWTRLYLGVHYPSDILAGWAASIAWAVGVSFLIRPQRLNRETASEG